MSYNNNNHIFKPRILEKNDHKIIVSLLINLSISLCDKDRLSNPVLQKKRDVVYSRHLHHGIHL